MPEILVGLLRSFWPWVSGLFMFGAAGSYSVWGGTQSANGTPGGILDTVWSAIKGVITAPANVFGSLTGTAHKAVRSAVSHWALANEKAQAAWFTHMNLLARETYSSNVATANAAADAIERLRFHVIPREITAATLPIAKTARSAQTSATKALAREHALSETFTTTHRAQVVLNHHYTHAIDVALPRTIGGIRTREEALSRDQAKLKERTTSLENGAIKTWEWMRGHAHSLATEAFAGAVAIALTSLGFGFLRCRNWKSLGGRLTCGMGKLLEDLLFGLIDVLIVADLCQLTGLMLQVAESSEVQTVLTDLTTGIEDLMRCQGVTRADPLAGYWTDPPPAQAFSALPVAA